MGGKGSGRKAKPIEQKQRLGNLGKRKLPQRNADVVHLPVREIPEPHRPLATNFGRRMWDAVWTAGAGWLKPNMDAEIVLMACEAIDERVALRNQVMLNSANWRERRGLRELDKQIASLLGQIGFAPADRAALGVTDGKQHEFHEIRQRINAKRSASQ
jgi:hypothetical protein